MKNVIHLAGVLFLAFLFSCSKSDNNNNNGGGTGSGTYLPLTAGTTWTFKDSATQNLTTATVTNQHLTVGSRTYTAIAGVNLAQNDTVWAAVDGPNYYYYATTSVSGAPAPVSLTLYYLSDTTAVGHSWHFSAGQVSGSDIAVVGTIVEKGIQMTVNGKSFTNVVHSQLRLSTNIFGTDYQLGTYDFYLAKGVGIIMLRVNVGTPGSTTTTSSSITDYHIQ